MLAEQGAGSSRRSSPSSSSCATTVPDMRSGTTNPDPVVARLCRPFTVLGARLAALPDTTLLVLEPGHHHHRGRAPPAPLVLTISPASWHLGQRLARRCSTRSAG